MAKGPILLFGIHCHQPVGNFERVMEYACKRAYLPFLEAMREYSLPFAVHYSGPLLDFLQETNSPVIDLVGEMVEKGQAEVLVSGLYEPVLPAIPSWDRLGQLQMAVERVKVLWGAEPRGLWLTERVWEPQVLKEIVEAGLDYMVVDDHHLLCGGVKREDIHGYFLTEEDGETLAVFPISKPLRYMVPFKKMGRVKACLQELPPGTAQTLFDDGEKFGLWPGTHDWVYRRGWLKRFLSFLQDGRVTVQTFERYLKEHPPTGRVYLPAASYPEMGQWALSPEYAIELARLQKGLQKEENAARIFLRGGVWRNFLVRYPEANWLHKRMLQVSRQVREMEESAIKEEARVHLYRSQCNDAYWHGVFGGLYAPHLRRALWRELLLAQGLCLHLPEGKGMEIVDLDCDGREEVLMGDGGIFAAFKPHCGGAMVELSHLDWGECFTNVLTRRPEAYHIEMADPEREEGGVASIHRLESAPPAGITYDGYQKLSFLDHLMFRPSKRALEEGRLDGPVSLHQLPYRQAHGQNSLQLQCEACWQDGSILVTKLLALQNQGLSARYQVEMNPGSPVPSPMHFGVELNLIMPSERFGDIRAVGPGGGRHIPVVKGGVARGCREVELRDPLWPGWMRVSVSQEADLFVTSNTSVSKSERGFDRVYQGNTLLFSFGLEGGREEFCLEIDFLKRKG